MLVINGDYRSSFPSLAALANGICTGHPCIFKLDRITPELRKKAKDFLLKLTLTTSFTCKRDNNGDCNIIRVPTGFWNFSSTRVVDHMWWLHHALHLHAYVHISFWRPLLLSCAKMLKKNSSSYYSRLTKQQCINHNTDVSTQVSVHTNPHVNPIRVFVDTNSRANTTLDASSYIEIIVNELFIHKSCVYFVKNSALLVVTNVASRSTSQRMNQPSEKPLAESAFNKEARRRPKLMMPYR